MTTEVIPSASALMSNAISPAGWKAELGYVRLPQNASHVAAVPLPAPCSGGTRLAWSPRGNEKAGRALAGRSQRAGLCTLRCASSCAEKAPAQQAGCLERGDSRTSSDLVLPSTCLAAPSHKVLELRFTAEHCCSPAAAPLHVGRCLVPFLKWKSLAQSSSPSPSSVLRAHQSSAHHVIPRLAAPSA